MPVQRPGERHGEHLELPAARHEPAVAGGRLDHDPRRLRVVMDQRQQLAARCTQSWSTRGTLTGPCSQPAGIGAPPVPMPSKHQAHRLFGMWNTAKLLRCAVGTVKSHRAKALATLRVTLGEPGDLPVGGRA